MAAQDELAASVPLLCEYGEAPTGYAGPMHWCHVHRQWHPWRAAFTTAESAPSSNTPDA